MSDALDGQGLLRLRTEHLNCHQEVMSRFVFISKCNGGARVAYFLLLIPRFLFSFISDNVFCEFIWGKYLRIIVYI